MRGAIGCVVGALLAGCLLSFDEGLLPGDGPGDAGTGRPDGGGGDAGTGPSILTCGCTPASCADVCTEGQVGSGCDCTATCPARRTCAITCDDGGTCDVGASDGARLEAGCEGGGPCTWTCTDSTCAMSCDGSSCTGDCSAGTCSADVTSEATLTMSCALGANCSATCAAGTRCEITRCQSNSVCVLHCAAGATCTITNCPAGAQDCPDGSVVCRADCP